LRESDGVKKILSTSFGITRKAMRYKSVEIENIQNLSTT